MGEHHGERKKALSFRRARSTHARKHACDDATRATFSHQKIPPSLPDPLVDDATCNDAGGSVTDAHFRVQSNPDSGEKQEGGGSGLTEEVREIVQ